MGVSCSYDDCLMFHLQYTCEWYSDYFLVVKIDVVHVVRDRRGARSSGTRIMMRGKFGHVNRIVSIYQAAYQNTLRVYSYIQVTSVSVRGWGGDWVSCRRDDRGASICSCKT